MGRPDPPRWMIPALAASMLLTGLLVALVMWLWLAPEPHAVVPWGVP